MLTVVFVALCGSVVGIDVSSVTISISPACHCQIIPSPLFFQHTHTHIHMNAQTCKHALGHTYTHTHAQIQRHASVHTCTHTHVYTCIQLHTQTHTHTHMHLWTLFRFYLLTRTRNDAHRTVAALWRISWTIEAKNENSLDLIWVSYSEPVDSRGVCRIQLYCHKQPSKELRSHARSNEMWSVGGGRGAVSVWPSRS